MARHTGGWIKLWRVSLEKDLFQNVYLWSIWHALLHMAVWKETQIIWRGRQRILPPGSVVIGIKDLADRWDCSQRTVSKWLKYLHDTQRIVLETCSRGTVVTICNWDKYQGGDDFLFAPSAHEVGAKSEPSRNQVGLSEEGKKERREEVRKNGTSPKGAEPGFDFEGAYRIFPKRDGGKGMGKSAGMRALQRQIKTPEDFERLRRAVENYAAFVAAKRKADPSWCYSVQWSTFCSPTSDTTWLDWVEVERPDSVDSPKGGTVDERAASRARLDAWAKEQGLL